MPLLAPARHAVAGLAVGVLAFLLLHWPIFETFCVALVALAILEAMAFARRLAIHVDGRERLRARDALEIAIKLTILGLAVWVLGEG